MRIYNQKVAAYVRLSKEDEKESDKKQESESISNQKELIIKYVAQNNLGNCEFFIDDGYSGGNFERPNFKKMINEIESGNISTVITKDTSRLGRDFIETSHYMFKYFPEHNVRYIAILENFDTFKPNGVEDMIPFQTIINDWYLKDTSKKIKSVRQNKMRQGLYMGSTIPYGYKRSEDDRCKFEIDEYSSKIVKRIFNMRLDGMRPTMIARILTDEKIEPPSIYNGKKIKKTYTTYIWNISTINHILSNPIYIGTMVQRKFAKINYKSKKKIKLHENEWITVENCVPPIISKEDYDNVQIMKKNNVTHCSKGYSYLLKGLVVCGDCGRVMSVRNRTTKRKRKEDYKETYYCCSNNIRYRHGVCSLHYFQEQKLNDIVITYLKNALKKYANKSKMQEAGKNKANSICEIQNLEKEIMKYNKKIQNLQDAIKNLYLDKLKGIVLEEEYIELKVELEKDKKEYVKKIEELQETINIKQKKNGQTSIIDRKINDFLELKKPNKQILMDFIQKVEIMEDKQVKIYVKYNLDSKEEMINEI